MQDYIDIFLTKYPIILAKIWSIVLDLYRKYEQMPWWQSMVIDSVIFSLLYRLFKPFLYKYIYPKLYSMVGKKFIPPTKRIGRREHAEHQDDHKVNNYDGLAKEEERSTKDIKNFSMMCDFNGQQSAFTFYLGYPEPTHHPLTFQAAWLNKSRGGTPAPDIMESLQKILKLSIENNVKFVDLADYAIKSALEQKTTSEAVAVDQPTEGGNVIEGATSTAPI